MAPPWTSKSSGYWHKLWCRQMDHVVTGKFKGCWLLAAHWHMHPVDTVDIINMEPWQNQGTRNQYNQMAQMGLQIYKI